MDRKNFMPHQTQLAKPSATVELAEMSEEALSGDGRTLELSEEDLEGIAGGQGMGDNAWLYDRDAAYVMSYLLSYQEHFEHY